MTRNVTPEELSDARKILAHEDEYVALPDRFEIDEYLMMERFAIGIQDAPQGDELLAALRGRGAFRRFKDAVYRLGRADEWHSFRDRAYEDIARTCCEENNIDVHAQADA